MSRDWNEIVRFDLPQAEVDKVFLFSDGVISVKDHYADTMAAALSKELPGRYTSFSKPSVNKTSIVFRFAKSCSKSEKCAKKWKIVCSTESLLEGRKAFVISTNSIDCNHTHQLMPRPLAGGTKSKVSDMLASRSNIAIIQNMTEQGNVEQLLEGNSQVPTLASLQNLRRRTRQQGDLHSDDHIDIVMRSLQQDRNFVRCVTSPAFSAVLMMQQQVDVLRDWIQRTDYREAFLDATGDIVRSVEGSPVLHHVLLIQVMVPGNKNHIPFNVAEMLTESQTMRKIARFLEDVLEFIYLSVSKRNQLFHQVVTDKSFANIGAILKVLNNGINLSRYLEICWDICQNGQEDLLKDLTLVRLCSSHTSKTMSDEIRRHFSDYEMTMKLKAAIGLMFNIKDFTKLLQYCKYFLFALMSPKKGINMEKILKATKTLVLSLDPVEIKQEPDDDDNTDEIPSVEESDSVQEKQSTAIYRNSECFKVLDKYINEEAEYDLVGLPNLSYNPGFAAVFLKNHLSYLFLWSNVMSVIRSPNQPRANNGAIENYFQLKKRIVREAEFTELGHICKVKVGRYVPFLARHILSQVKTISFGIPSRSRSLGRRAAADDSQIDDNDLPNCTERYRRKGVKPKESSFFPKSSSQSSQSTSASAHSSQQTSLSSQSLRRSLSEPALTQPLEEDTGSVRFPFHYSSQKK